MWTFVPMVLLKAVLRHLPLIPALSSHSDVRPKSVNLGSSHQAPGSFHWPGIIPVKIEALPHQCNNLIIA
jgi:hypothetical protein